MKHDLSDPDRTSTAAPAPTHRRIPDDLIAAIQDVYKPAGMQLTAEVMREAESAEYGACRFGLDGRSIVFRVAKTTPTKIGQFVTLWKRPTAGSAIAPLDVDDGIAFIVVSVFDDAHRGQFVFDQKTLASKGIFGTNGKGGKRAIRVYPPWVKPVAKEAVRTQGWQLRYFLPFDHNGCADPVQVHRLFAQG